MKRKDCKNYYEKLVKNNPHEKEMFSKIGACAYYHMKAGDCTGCSYYKIRREVKGNRKI